MISDIVMFTSSVPSDPETQSSGSVNIIGLLVTLLCLVLVCQPCRVWSQTPPQDDGSCDISDFLCPVPEGLSFNSSNELNCFRGQGHGQMVDPVIHQLCAISTFPPGSYNGERLCMPETRLCGEIRCPYGCYVDASPECQCYARWGFCYTQEPNQTVSPDNCLTTCGTTGHATCQAITTPTTATDASLSPLELGFIVSGGISLLIVTVTCVIGVGRYYLRRHYQLRYRDYQPLPGGADITPPKI